MNAGVSFAQSVGVVIEADQDAYQIPKSKPKKVASKKPRIAVTDLDTGHRNQPISAVLQADEAAIADFDEVLKKLQKANPTQCVDPTKSKTPKKSNTWKLRRPPVIPQSGG